MQEPAEVGGGAIGDEDADGDIVFNPFDGRQALVRLVGRRCHPRRTRFANSMQVRGPDGILSHQAISAEAMRQLLYPHSSEVAARIAKLSR
jgi:hypothetical protein